MACTSFNRDSCLIALVDAGKNYTTISFQEIKNINVVFLVLKRAFEIINKELNLEHLTESAQVAKKVMF